MTDPSAMRLPPATAPPPAWPGKVLVAALWCAGVAVAGPPAALGFAVRLGLAGGGLALAAAAHAAWDERLRPLRPGWWLLVALAAISLLFGPLAAVPACAFVAGLALASAAASAPGALLVAGVLALLWRDPASWGASETLQGWQVALGTLVVVAAAAAERERAARTTSTPVAAAWMVLVLGVVAIWTGTLLLLRDLLRGTDLLPFIQSGSVTGKVVLVGLLLLCVTGAGLLLRSRKAPSI